MDSKLKGKSAGKRVLRVLLLLLALGICCGAGLVGYVAWQEHHLPQVVPSDVIIVLGAQVKPDGTPSKQLNYRLEMALEVYEAGPQKIITCGAQGANEPGPEGQIMREWLIARGVPAGDVFAEVASFNTRENLRGAKAIMEAQGLSQALVVTSDYHVARALELCRREGIAATGIGSETEAPYWIKNHVREALSWLKLWLVG